jgi:hypothetical protein
MQKRQKVQLQMSTQSRLHSRKNPKKSKQTGHFHPKRQKKDRKLSIWDRYGDETFCLCFLFESPAIWGCSCVTYKLRPTGDQILLISSGLQMLVRHFQGKVRRLFLTCSFLEARGERILPIARTPARPPVHQKIIATTRNYPIP